MVLFFLHFVIQFTSPRRLRPRDNSTTNSHTHTTVAPHRRQLHEVIELLEYCTTTLRHPEQHDRLWEQLVAARARTDSLRQQLQVITLPA